MGAMPQAAFHAGVQAAADVAVSLYERERSGLGQHLDVSAQACMVWTLMNATGYPPNTGRNPPGTSEFRGQPHPAAARQRLRLPGNVECRDGLIQVRFQMRHIGERTFDALLRWVEVSDMEVPDNVRGLDLKTWLSALRAGELDLEAAQAAADLIEALLTTKTKQEIQLYSAQHGLTLAAIHTIPDLLRDPHLADRDFWLPQPARHGGRERIHAGPFARLSRTPLSLNRGAPAVGILGRAPPASAKGTNGMEWSALRRAQGGGFQLGGRRADDRQGAGRSRRHRWCASSRRTGSTCCVRRRRSRTTNQGQDRAQFMANFNTSKLGMTIDLKNPEGPKLARRMADWADVVLESYSPGTMARFGLDWETLSADRDDLLMLSTSMRGQTGRGTRVFRFRRARRVHRRLFNLVGWPDRQPSGPWGAYTDFISPRFGISALVAALMHRRRTGLGQYIDLAQIECGIRFIEPLILDYAATGRGAERLGQASPNLDPHGVFPCTGEQRYVAVGVETATERQALETLLDGRELGDWCRERDAFDAAAELRGVGVPAYAVLRPSDLYEDSQLAHRGFFETLDHPVMGPTPYDGPATIYSRTPQRLRSPAPCLGQHNDEVLRDCLEMDTAEIDHLRRNGALR